MDVFGIYLTTSRMRNICILILALNTATVVLCVFLLCYVVYVGFIMPIHPKLIASFESFLLPNGTALLGSIRLVLATSVSKTWSEVKSKYEPVVRAIRRWLHPTVLGHLLMTLLFFTFSFSILLRSSYASQPRFMRAMRFYRTDVELKCEIDQTQMGFECCGGGAHSDWFYVHWADESYLDEKQVRSRYHVPFSCCTPYALRPCIRWNVKSTTLYPNYIYPKDITLFGSGCGVKLDQFLEGFRVVVGGSFLLLAFLELFQLVLGRLVQTYFSSGEDEATRLDYGYIFRGN